MASRLATGVASSQNGTSYAGGQAASGVSIDIGLSRNSAAENSAVPGTLANAIVGTTIGGNVVGPIEVWSDGAVWDTSNSRFLRPVIDYDVTLLHRSGFGG